MTVQRSLFLHSDLRRRPYDILRSMLAQVDPETPPHGPDGPVAVLERRVASLLGKDEALFFPSGTMAQQVALRIHADRRGRRAFAAHPQCHLEVWEQQGYAVVHGLRFQAVGDRHRLMTLADLAAVAEPLAAVVWELPQRDIGGQLPEWDDLVPQTVAARERGAGRHLDGARLWEAQTYYRRPFAEIAALFDTVYVSFYKGLQGVGGAALAGDASLVAEARVWRRRLGGDVYDAWPLALTALHGLDTLLPRLPAHRDHAVAIAAAINADGVARAFPDPPQTPLFHVHLPVGPDAAMRAADALLAADGVELFGRVRSAPAPDRCSFEVSVGENAMELAPDEVVTLIHELLRHAA
ncbi:threonine aldolase family protein [Micromonospora parathelypteridis]|uniref:Threonine aldolase n=1 Tax=Micromonospora parathelypteridis TaxID=1839617 RepID=A0A840VUV5_9ACTN|nr:beta-eliminating lyase-related protein [Micromonospora parathelypteridis]MBB5475989.1 threonine aldolase [Micromonospora parathelypteridis]GGO32302.1 threonine aldolase [Micromonospora parathelypteridis]